MFKFPAKMITSVEMNEPNFFGEATGSRWLNKYQLKLNKTTTWRTNPKGGTIKKDTNSPAKKTMNEPLGTDNLGSGNDVSGIDVTWKALLFMDSERFRVKHAKMGL